jgi:hypothetical protein
MDLLVVVVDDVEMVDDLKKNELFLFLNKINFYPRRAGTRIVC